MLYSEAKLKPMFGPDHYAALAFDVRKRNWPKFLPEEFRIYLDGAVDYREKNFDAAAGHFEKLLALPLDERRFRSTWATYMLGRIALAQGDVDMKKSIPHFRRVHAEREAGCHDSLGLGWDALALEAEFLDQSDNIEDRKLALRYRFAIAWEGKGKVIPTMRDLRSHALGLLESGKARDIAIDDPFVRKVVTAAALNSANKVFYWKENQALKSEIDEWVEFLKTIDLTADEAPLCAHFAYGRGDFESAKRFVKKAPLTDPTAIWIRAKLTVKEKQFRTASRLLSQADQGFPREFENGIPRFYDEWRNYASDDDFVEHRASQFWGNRAILQLACDDYVPALESFLRSGHWRDAAYVAEQLLSREELLTYVRDRWPTHEAANGAGMPQAIRYLTARRLARERYFKDARLLFPPKLREIFDVYVENYRVFRDGSQPEMKRAKAGWAAAQIHRRLGMELFGTEVGPDFAFCRGRFSLSFRYELYRQKILPDDRIAETVNHYRNPKTQAPDYPDGMLRSFERRRKSANFPAVTPSEKWRHRHYAKLPNVYRFHYRHVAADLAWEAAALMPDETEEKALVLNTAGRWISAEHPENADFFYKNMVRKNRTTPLGHLADQRRWFADSSWRRDYDPWKSNGLKNPGQINFDNWP